MGKDLKGKECGKGICQRKDGLYSARYTVDGKTRYFALQYPYWKQKLVELKYDNSITHKRSDEPYLTSSKLSDRTAEIAIQRKILSDYIRMVEQAAIEAEPELYSYILKAVTENLTFVVLKQAYDMPCERDMFYDRRRKFYWALSRVR